MVPLTPSAHRSAGCITAAARAAAAATREAPANLAQLSFIGHAALRLEHCTGALFHCVLQQNQTKADFAPKSARTHCAACRGDQAATSTTDLDSSCPKA